MDEFVDAYSRRSGRKTRIPRRLLGTPMAAGLALTPRQKARDRKERESKEGGDRARQHLHGTGL